MKFNYLILFLLFQLEYIRPLHKSNEKKLEGIDYKINFDKMVQVSFKKDNLNTKTNFFLQLKENSTNGTTSILLI